MTLPMSETHTDVIFTDRLNHQGKSNGTETFDKKELDEEKENLDGDGSDRGFAILLIDKTGGIIDSDELSL